MSIPELLIDLVRQIAMDGDLEVSQAHTATALEYANEPFELVPTTVIYLVRSAISVSDAARS